MKYMLLIYSNEQDWQDDEREACFVESTQVAHDLASERKFLGASPLLPVSSAISVRIREGQRLVTDGPFAETREQLGGYFLIEADSADEAVEVASRIPGARKGTVEVRPILELPNLPQA